MHYRGLLAALYAMNGRERTHTDVHTMRAVGWDTAGQIDRSVDIMLYSTAWACVYIYISQCAAEVLKVNTETVVMRSLG